MARSDLLLTLVRAGKRGDQSLLRKAVEAIATEERAKRHSVFAEQLLATIAESSPPTQLELPSKLNGIGHGPLWYEVAPRQTLSSLILTDVVKTGCAEIIEEHQRLELLRSHGIEPRHRLLLSGPPGNGKTVLAEALAEALMLPLIIPRYEAIIGSYLGETSARVAKLFDYVRARQCVLFLDEFDALGKERGDARETGEIKRVVSTLLLQIDAIPSHAIIVAATNHAESLDRAVWRRFQLRLSLPAPTLQQATEWIAGEMARFDWQCGLTPRTIATRLKCDSFAEIADFCLDVRRKLVLAQGSLVGKEIVQQRINQWTHRVRPAHLK